MFWFTAERFRYFLSVKGFHLFCGSFWMHNIFVNYIRRTTVKRNCKSSAKLKLELFTFKLRLFRNNINNFRENYQLIFSKNFTYHWKEKSMCLIHCVIHVWQHIYVIRVWLQETLYFHWKCPTCFRCLLNKRKVYFNTVTLDTDSTQVTY